MFAKGTAAVVAVTAIGFFVSIFFPTLYSLVIVGMGDLTGQASGLLTMGFVGCALIPVLQGRLADTIGLQLCYALGVGAYLLALLYALDRWRKYQDFSHMVCNGDVTYFYSWMRIWRTAAWRDPGTS
jgi:FHS family L-fucose permease-like MFS transporter